MKRFLSIFIILLGLVLTLGSCTTLKPYQRVYVNDAEMQMNASSDVKFGLYVFSIREGALTALGQKGGGGCGCN